MISAFVHALPLFRQSPRLWKPPPFSPTHRIRRHVTAMIGSADKNGDAPSNIDIYNDWVAKKDPSGSKEASSNFHSNISAEPLRDTPHPPKFAPRSLFHPGAEEYAARMSSPASDDFVFLAQVTAEAGLYAPCMVGAVEGQFLKMVTQMKKARRVLDVGTFTGYSALSFADGLSSDDCDAKVITIEADGPTAKVARVVFERAKNGHRIELIEDDGLSAMMKLRESGATFDIVFLDADKVNYQKYYELGIDMLGTDGVLMADNALCSLVYKEDDPARQALHEFAQHVRADPRVEQLMVTVREGILIVHKV